MKDHNHLINTTARRLTELSTQKAIKPMWMVTIVSLIASMIIFGCTSTESLVNSNANDAAQREAIQLQIIGQKVYNNETGGNLKNLIYWSPNEDFASLGIGHFIWYPKGRSQGFKETFPDLIRYLKAEGAEVPTWLLYQIKIGSLWNSKAQLEQNRERLPFKALQTLLIDTKDLQVSYLFKRLEKALPKMLSATPADQHATILKRFNTVKTSPLGRYPLLDYINFKGEGVALSERYAGFGWGLLQVLEVMEDKPAGPEALKAFAAAADIVLTRRVNNAPVGKDESHWLPGWRRRLMSYYQSTL